MSYLVTEKVMEFFVKSGAHLYPDLQEPMASTFVTRSTCGGTQRMIVPPTSIVPEGLKVSVYKEFYPYVTAFVTWISPTASMFPTVATKDLSEKP